VKIDIPIDIEPESLLKYLNGTEKRKFVLDLVSGLDSDTYHAVAVFVYENPDTSVECPRCKRYTYKSNFIPKCHYCMAVLP
jgi:transposase-like protein